MMYQTILEQRDIVVDALVAEKDNLILPYDVTRTVYRAVFRTETLSLSGQCKVTVCGLGFDEQALTKATKQRELQIQVGIEASYTSDAIAEKYIQLTEAIATLCSGLPDWVANRMSLDEHGLPYQFHVLREQSVYQSIFAAVFNTQGRRFHQGEN